MHVMGHYPGPKRAVYASLFFLSSYAIIFKAICLIVVETGPK
jgi:hypothetical protein